MKCKAAFEKWHDQIFQGEEMQVDSIKCPNSLTQAITIDGHHKVFTNQGCPLHSFASQFVNYNCPPRMSWSKLNLVSSHIFDCLQALESERLVWLERWSGAVSTGNLNTSKEAARRVPLISPGSPQSSRYPRMCLFSSYCSTIAFSQFSISCRSNSRNVLKYCAVEDFSPSHSVSM